jgi:hypothetical protein
LKKLLLVVAALFMLATSVVPARAVWYEPFGTPGMFDRFTYAGAVYNTKSFYLFDRTGVSAQHAALQEYVQSWNAEINNRGWVGVVPVIAYVQDDANYGVCSSGSDSSGPLPMRQVAGAEYTYVLACAGTPTGGIGLARGASVLYGRHIRTYGVFPFAMCAQYPRAPYPNLTHDNLVRCWAHEIGHLMGIPHNNTVNHLMNTDGSGIYANNWYDNDTFTRLRALYPAGWQD